jgi:hypothetical protein
MFILTRFSFPNSTDISLLKNLYTFRESIVEERIVRHFPNPEHSPCYTIHFCKDYFHLLCKESRAPTRSSKL